MQFADRFKNDILTINETNYESHVLEVFDYQFHQCKIYQEYCTALGKNPSNTKRIHQIPFLPIEFFKNHAVKSGNWKEEKIFKSSGTTQLGRSVHFVKDLAFYRELSKHAFEAMFVSLTNLQLLALLPSYQQQGESSLIEMVDFFIRKSSPKSNYYLRDDQGLAEALAATDEKKLLIGVSYALLDFIENNSISTHNTMIMETGGMKGRRKEMTRAELHKNLTKGFNQEEIYSEYGMTELFSQAYGKNGLFSFPKWASVLIRDINDPFCYLGEKKTGGINIIDLANIDSCSFIETKDLGRSHKNAFEVLGRFDNSDIRGCNLMIHRNA